jgi:threonyl-tRNA synthetase
VASIGAAQARYAEAVAARLSAQGYRAVADVRPWSLSRKIVAARELGVPLLLAAGAREAAEETVSLRRRDGVQEALPVAALDARLRVEAFR